MRGDVVPAILILTGEAAASGRTPHRNRRLSVERHEADVVGPSKEMPRLAIHQVVAGCGACAERAGRSWGAELAVAAAGPPVEADELPA